MPVQNDDKLTRIRVFMFGRWQRTYCLNSEWSDSKSIVGSTISEQKSFEFATLAVDMTILTEVGNSGATSG